MDWRKKKRSSTDRTKSRSFLRRFLHREVETSSCLARRFIRLSYLAFVPNQSAFDVEDVPGALLRRFTTDGKLLIAFSANRADVLLYRPVEYFDVEEDPARPNEKQSFKSFFHLERTITIGTEREILVDDFCLCSPSCKYVIFATRGLSSNTDQAPTTSNISSFYSVELESGKIIDRYIIHEGMFELDWSVHMLSNRLVFLSPRKKVRNLPPSLHYIRRLSSDKLPSHRLPRLKNERVAYLEPYSCIFFPLSQVQTHATETSVIIPIPPLCSRSLPGRKFLPPPSLRLKDSVAP